MNANADAESQVWQQRQAREGEQKRFHKLERKLQVIMAEPESRAA